MSRLRQLSAVWWKLTQRAKVATLEFATDLTPRLPNLTSPELSSASSALSSACHDCPCYTAFLLLVGGMKPFARSIAPRRIFSTYLACLRRTFHARYFPISFWPQSNQMYCARTDICRELRFDTCQYPNRVSVPRIALAIRLIASSSSGLSNVSTTESCVPRLRFVSTSFGRSKRLCK